MLCWRELSSPSPSALPSLPAMRAGRGPTAQLEAFLSLIPPRPPPSGSGELADDEGGEPALPYSVITSIFFVSLPVEESKMCLGL